jgi:hypothetical protein
VAPAAQRAARPYVDNRRVGSRMEDVGGWVCVCVCACVRACVFARACLRVRACVRACVRVSCLPHLVSLSFRAGRLAMPSL